MTTTNATLPVADARLTGFSVQSLARAAAGVRALAAALAATMRELLAKGGQEDAELRRLYRLCSYGDGISPGLAQALRERKAA